jgi:hypothetical protein
MALLIVIEARSIERTATCDSVLTWITCSITIVTTDDENPMPGHRRPIHDISEELSNCRCIRPKELADD